MADGRQEIEPVTADFLMREVHRLQDERDKRYAIQFQEIDSLGKSHILRFEEKIQAVIDSVNGADRRYEELQVAADRRYEDKYVALEKALMAAIDSRKEVTDAVFVASERAIQKAEKAQREYNEHTNEFRAQLTDQARTLLTRNEAEVSLKALDVKIQDLKNDIVELREYKSRALGAETATMRDRLQANWQIGIWIALGLGIVGLYFRH